MGKKKKKPGRGQTALSAQEREVAAAFHLTDNPAVIRNQIRELKATHKGLVSGLQMEVGPYQQPADTHMAK